MNYLAKKQKETKETQLNLIESKSYIDSFKKFTSLHLKNDIQRKKDVIKIKTISSNSISDKDRQILYICETIFMFIILLSLYELVYINFEFPSYFKIIFTTFTIFLGGIKLKLLYKNKSDKNNLNISKIKQ